MTPNEVTENNEPWLKPIIRNVEDVKLPYKKDELFYSLWKYANARRLTGKSLVAFTDLAPLEGNPRFAIFEFLHSLRELNVELEDITFHEGIYKKYCKTEHDVITEYITKNPKTGFSNAVKKLFKNKATFKNVFKILGEFNGLGKMKLQLNGFLEFIGFSPAPSEKNIKPLKNELDGYLKCFIEDKLFSSDIKNFYKFSKQKEIFLYQIESDVRDYGSEFVFKQGETVSIRKGGTTYIAEDMAYLFIHTLAALEKQGFFEVENIFIESMDIPPEEQTDDYTVRITAFGKLLDKEVLPSQKFPSEQEDSAKDGLLSKKEGIQHVEDQGASESIRQTVVWGIIIIKPKEEGGRRLVVINGLYKQAKTISKRSVWWDALYKIIKEETVPYRKEMADYFNYSQKCAVYFKGQYSLSTILENLDGNFKVADGIETEIISWKAYQRRLKA